MVFSRHWYCRRIRYICGSHLLSQSSHSNESISSCIHLPQIEKQTTSKSHGAPSGPNGQNSSSRPCRANGRLAKRALLWTGTLTGDSECESSKLETKFKDLSYEIGLRKPVQQQLQRKMGGLDQQAKENVARPMFDVAKLTLRISSLKSGYRTLRYELTSIDSAQWRAFLEIKRKATSSWLLRAGK